MKKFIFILFLVFSFILSGASETLGIPFPDLVNPDSIHISNNMLLITDGETVLLYRLKDFSLVKRFGKKGEGPGEFKFPSAGVVKLHVVLTDDRIIVNSMNRVTFFDPDGTYVNETNVRSGFHFVPLGDRYAGYSVIKRGKTNVLAVNLYNRDFEFQKEIFNKAYYVQTSGRFDLVRAGSGNKRRAYYLVYKNRLYVEGENRIHVFDPNGAAVRVITPHYHRLGITTAQKDEIQESLTKLFPSPLMQKLIQDNGVFPSRFPVRAFLVSDDRIWIPSYNRKGGETLFMVSDLTGNPEGSVWFPFYHRTLLIPYPFTIFRGKMYQLFDEDGEDWKLVVSSSRRNE